MFGAWEGPEIAAFWIAIGASLIGSASLGWQLWTWKRSGAVVDVTVAQSFPVYGEHVGDPHVCVTAQNNGRGPATVINWGFETPGGGGLVDPNPLAWSTRLPFTLAPGGAPGTWYAETKKIVNGCARNNIDPAQLKAWVKLGNGKTVYAKRRGIGLKA